MTFHTGPIEELAEKSNSRYDSLAVFSRSTTGPLKLLSGARSASEHLDAIVERGYLVRIDMDIK